MSSLRYAAAAVALLAPGVAAFSAPGMRAVRRSTSLSAGAALIVQNKGGGHGELGYQLAKVLTDMPDVSSVTILQDDACKETAEPFCSYSTDLPGVEVARAPLSSDESMSAGDFAAVLGGKKFEYVFDNCSKGPVGAGAAVVECASDWKSSVYAYVSSAGIYVPDATTTFPMSEASTPIKESAGQFKQEQHAVAKGLPLVSFRPQYIYGKKSSKHDYVDWFFDRIVRGRALPIPGDGTQLVSLTNSEDVARLLACAATSTEAAVTQQIFNCGTDKLVSYNDLAYLCADAAGVSRGDVKIHHYDAAALGKGKFPFRPTNFYVAPDLAKEKIGFSGANADIVEDLVWYFEGWQTRGRKTAEVDFSKDDEILKA